MSFYVFHDAIQSQWEIGGSWTMVLIQSFLALVMMTIWHGNVFHITDPFLQESIGHWQITLTQGRNAELFNPNKLLNKLSRCQWFEIIMKTM